MQITNNGTASIAFEVDINKPVKFVSKLIIQGGTTVTVSIEEIIPLVLFDTAFQTAVTGGTITLAYTAADTTYLTNINSFLAGTL